MYTEIFQKSPHAIASALCPPCRARSASPGAGLPAPGFFVICRNAPA
nr:MAG TPA: hypothetical protein [Caudoviricetes sp.]